MNFTEIRFADKEETNWVLQPGTLFVSVDAVGNSHHTNALEDISNGAVVQPWVDPATPYQKWHNDISKLDKDMPRSLEDMLDGMPDKSGVAQITLDRLQEKKTLREAKP